MLDAADMLVVAGGRSRDRLRHKGQAVTEKPVRKYYRPWRNRAIIYLLIETGMRRSGVVNANLVDLDKDRSTIETREKGASPHAYKISREGLRAVLDYIELERDAGTDPVPPALFLPAMDHPRATGRLSPRAINLAWNEVARMAGVQGRSPHSARHAMGRHIIEKTGNLAAVQRQLGHKRIDYSAQYARISGEELQGVLDER